MKFMASLLKFLVIGGALVLLAVIFGPTLLEKIKPEPKTPEQIYLAEHVTCDLKVTSTGSDGFLIGTVHNKGKKTVSSIQIAIEYELYPDHEDRPGTVDIGPFKPGESKRLGKKIFKTRCFNVSSKSVEAVNLRF